MFDFDQGASSLPHRDIACDGDAAVGMLEITTADHAHFLDEVEKPDVIDWMQVALHGDRTGRVQVSAFNI